MHSTVFDELRKQFRMKPSATERFSVTRCIKVFDRLAPDRFGWTSVGRDGIRSKRRGFLTPETSCEIYAYGGQSDAMITLEAINVYRACQSAFDGLVQALGGTIEDTERRWLARVSVPLTEYGANEIRQCAEVVSRQRRKGAKYNHRLADLSMALHKLANALDATVNPHRRALSMNSAASGQRRSLKGTV